jgi:hypothetical protein
MMAAEPNELLLQFLDTSDWRTSVQLWNGINANGGTIRRELEQLQQQMDGRAVRAVDIEGRIYDILPEQ